jgi:hypothetical protein
MKITTKEVYGKPYITRFSYYTAHAAFEVDYNSVTKELKDGFVIFNDGTIDVPEGTGYETDFNKFVSEIQKMYLAH